eukprot:Seg1159.13 transcript_id=Seg1159.13/GoldUCD/mRNA.D3Y31 product="Elongation factor 1-delta" protein_id=Seg1159.13/GoldUCD/D3Y31
MTGTEMTHESIWFDQPKYEEAESHYQLHLASVNGPTPASKVTSHGASALIDEIAKARNSIKKSLNEAPGSDRSVGALEKENKELRKIIDDLTKRMSALEMRMSKIEKASNSALVEEEPSAIPKEENKNDDDDDDDFDLFGSDEEEEEDESKHKEVVDKYYEKKATKKKVIAKSNIILDIKPWGDDTDLEEMERLVRGIIADGLVWGAAKLVPVAFGIKKLQISCVVEDDKIGTDYLEETITEFDDHVQSVDVAAFNKV